MKRLTMSLDDDLADAFEALVRERSYENRSEAFRDLLRQHLGEVRRVEHPQLPCVATLSYVYNHHQRQLASRLADMQHDHHELTIATTHAHLDHDHCIETVILSGQTAQVQSFAQSLIAQPGLSHGHLHLVPMAVQHAHGHDHLGPATAGPPEAKARSHAARPVLAATQVGAKAASRRLAGPALEPAFKPGVKPVVKPAVKSAARPAAKPNARPAAKPTAKPAVRLTVKPAPRPVDKSARPAASRTRKT